MLYIPLSLTTFSVIRALRWNFVFPVLRLHALVFSDWLFPSLDCVYCTLLLQFPCAFALWLLLQLVGCKVAINWCFALLACNTALLPVTRYSFRVYIFSILLLFDLCFRFVLRCRVLNAHSTRFIKFSMASLV